MKGNELAGQLRVLGQVLGRWVGLEVVVLGQIVEIRRRDLGGDAVHHGGGISGGVYIVGLRRSEVVASSEYEKSDICSRWTVVVSVLLSVYD